MSTKAASVYQRADQPDYAANLLERVSKVLEESEPETAEKLLEKAAEIVELENRPIQAAFFVSKVMHFRIDADDYTAAILKAKKLIQLYQEANQITSFGRSVLCSVLLCICAQNFVHGQKIAREYGNNCKSEQNEALLQLLEGCEKDDKEQIQSALNLEAFATLKFEVKKVFETLESNYKIDMKSSRNENESNEEDNELKMAKYEPHLEVIQENKEFNPPPKDSEPDNSSTANCPGDFLDTGGFNASRKWSFNRSATIAEIRTAKTSDLMSKNACIHTDVTGIDDMDPKFKGMTPDQWREMKRAAEQSFGSFDDS